MDTPAQIEADFVTALGTIAGLRPHAEKPPKVLPFSAWPELSADQGLQTMGGLDARYLYDVYLIVPSAKSRAHARSLLLPYLARNGAQSVYAAVIAQMSDVVLNVTLVRQPVIDMGEVEEYGAQWRVEVMSS